MFTALAKKNPEVARTELKIRKCMIKIFVKMTNCNQQIIIKIVVKIKNVTKLPKIYFVCIGFFFFFFK